MDEISHAAYTASLRETFAKCYAPWSRMPPEEWAEQVYRLPGGRRFKFAYAPYSLEMFRSLFDKRNRHVVFQLYSRGLKSTMILIGSGYRIDQAPCGMLFKWPTVGQAEKFMKDAMDGELFATTPCLNYLSSQAGKRIAANTILHKRFYGGGMTAFGSNAPGELRRAKGSWLAEDEIDADEETISDEGDISTIFYRRGAEFADTIIVSASYPSVKGRSKIAAKMNLSDGCQWLSTCVRCGGEPFVMHRSQLIYEPDRPETARFTCPRCGEHLTDAERYAMAHEQGFDNWKPQRAFTGMRGFHANAMLWPHPVDKSKFPGGFLQTLAQMEIDANNSENPKRAMRVIVNTVDAEPFDPTEESEQPPDWRKLFDARENYADRTGRIVVPQPVSLVTCFIDIQNNRLEMEWKGWARDEQSWGLAYTVLDGNPLDIQPGSVWHRCMTELRRTFRREDGAPLNLAMCFVDAGKWGDWAYLFYRLTRDHPDLVGKVILSKGVGKHGEPINCRKLASIHRNIKGIPIGAWAGKDLVYARLKLQRNEDGSFPSGFMHHPMSYDENYFQQLTSDHVVLEYKGSEEIRRYGNNEGKRDEALDCAYGNLAVFKLRNWNFDALEADLAERAQLPEPAPVKPQMAIARIGGWR